jgi:hypothetical protein
MSNSSDGIDTTLSVVGPSPELVLSSSEPAELDVRAATASELITELTRLEDISCAVNISDPNLPELRRRERAIRQEIGRREVLLMQGILWSDAPSTASKVAGRALICAVHSRNGRGGPGGPGDWDD